MRLHSPHVVEQGLGMRLHSPHVVEQGLGMRLHSPHVVEQGLGMRLTSALSTCCGAGTGNETTLWNGTICNTEESLIFGTQKSVLNIYFRGVL